MLKQCILFLVTVILRCDAEKFRFDNYTLYKVLPKTTDDILLLQNLQNNDLRYDFWNEPTPSREFVNILSSPEYKRGLEGLLTERGIRFEISMSNIQEAIDKEVRKDYAKGNLRINWDNYYDGDAINGWLDDLVREHRTIVTPLVIGESYEGRQLKGIKISHGSNRRAIFLEGGIHAREWISPATVTYITNELLRSTNVDIMNAAREYDWYIFPVTNPDGYEYTGTFRMWRKNRRPYGSEIGVDLNRNWNNNWMVIGASGNPAHDTYAGPGPFSEPETFHLSRFITSVGDQLDMYLTFHSYGQMLLIPFGNTTEHLANYDAAVNVGRRAMGALAVPHGTQYVTGNSAEVIYEASGASDDWVKERINPPLVYCYELRDTGDYSFLLPAEQIKATGEETMMSILELIVQGRRFGVLPNSRTSGLKMSASVVMFALIVQGGSRYMLINFTAQRSLESVQLRPGARAYS